MFTRESKKYIKFLPLIFLVVFATIQYVLILRHKSPIMSDSYFYKHYFYRMQGYTQEAAYQKNRDSIKFEKADFIMANIFKNQENYEKTASFFRRRVLYPKMAYLVNFFTRNEYLAFLIPVFVAYLGTIILTYYFFSKSFSHFFAAFGTSLLLAFYPFLEWATFFSTDVIGTFFWLSVVVLTYRYLVSKKRIFFILTAATIFISFLNREQTLLILPFFVIFWILRKKDIIKFVLISLALTVPFGLFSLVTKSGSITASLDYMRNSFGLNSNSYSQADNIEYILKSAVTSHEALLFDLTRHHWWFATTTMAAISLVNFFFAKKKHIVDSLMLSSGLASYFFIFWPFFSYRFLFPAAISLIYFTTKFLSDYEGRTRNRR